MQLIRKLNTILALNLTVLEKQIGLEKNMYYPGDRKDWFGGFLALLTTNVQLAVLGKSSPEKALKKAADYACDNMVLRGSFAGCTLSPVL